MKTKKIKYSRAILEAYEYLLDNYKEFFVMGQGLWSPWYVGSSMNGLEKKYGKERVIDCPISEQATTGAVIGAAICGYKAMIVHPRVDFMLLAMDQIVAQAAKWRYMFGGTSSAPATFRAIINRGGAQGAQHSQSLHSWFAHIPGLKVVMPYSAIDARDLLIASVLCKDPVVFIDDRWLYDTEEEYRKIEILDINDVRPKKILSGNHFTCVGLGYTSFLCENACKKLMNYGIACDFFDLRVLNPMDCDQIIESVKKTGRLIVVDGDWASCGISSEIISIVTENINPSNLKLSPIRMTLPNAPAPTSSILESEYFIKTEEIVEKILSIVV